MNNNNLHYFFRYAKINDIIIGTILIRKTVVSKACKHSAKNVNYLPNTRQ